jgi:YbbR domain-containing protein
MMRRKMNKKQMAAVIAILAAILTFIAVHSAKNR